MKKILLSLILAASVMGMFRAEACTNFLITKGASADGSTMITYAADAGGFLEPLFFLNPADHKPGDMLTIHDWDSHKYLGKIPQVPHTYGVVGNMNEWQVSIGETTFGGRDELRDTTGLIDYGTLIQLGLQRAKTAREAIKVMTDLVNTYGYYSGGESFSVADPDEVWILEMIGKGPGSKGAVWVARRIPDGYVAAHANQSRIRKVIMNDPENCMYSKDVISFAKEKNIVVEHNGEFSFADTYNPLDPGGALFCEGRVWRFFSLAAPSNKLNEDYWRAVKGAEPYPLYIKPDKKLTPRDLQAFMRDHFEGTEYDMTKGVGAGPFGCPYRWKNLTWKVDGDTVNSYGWERPIATQQSAFTFVSQMRSFMPREIGGVFWYGVDAASTSCYIPLYCSMTKCPEPFVGGSIKEFDMDKAFWVFNAVANTAYSKYSYMIEDIKKVQKQYEDKFELFQKPIEMAAQELYKKDKNAAIEYLTDYSVSSSENVVEAWRQLYKDLMVKYNDGYINDFTAPGNENGRHPKGVGYGNETFKRAIEERPGYYDVKWR
jgi:dipeptidase